MLRAASAQLLADESRVHGKYSLPCFGSELALFRLVGKSFLAVNFTFGCIEHAVPLLLLG